METVNLHSHHAGTKIASLAQEKEETTVAGHQNITWQMTASAVAAEMNQASIQEARSLLGHGLLRKV